MKLEYCVAMRLPVGAAQATAAVKLLEEPEETSV